MIHRCHVHIPWCAHQVHEFRCALVDGADETCLDGGLAEEARHFAPPMLSIVASVTLHIIAPELL